MGVTGATAVAPHTPPHFTDRDRGGVTTRPSNRKCDAQLWMCVHDSCVRMWKLFRMIGRQHSCVSCPCSGDVTVKACPSTEVARTEDPEDPGLAQGLVPNLAIANERTSRLSQKPPAEMASEQGAADYVYTCKRTSSLARYSTWSLPTTTAHSLLSMLQVALHSYMSVASALRLVHRILRQLHQISTTFRVGNSSLTHGNRAASIRSFSTTSGSSVSSNCIGPKSDGLHSKPGAKLMMMMLILSSNLQPTKSVFVDARVGAFSTTAPEAVGHASAAKHSGLRRASEPNPQLHLTRSGKRSYRRAYGRACRMGEAHPTKADGGHGHGSNPDSFSLSLLVIGRLLRYLLQTPGVPSHGTREDLRPTFSRSLKRMPERCAMISSVCRKPNGGTTAPGPTRTFIIFTAKGLARKIGLQDF